jgi:hypothetical protein
MVEETTWNDEQNNTVKVTGETEKYVYFILIEAGSKDESKEGEKFRATKDKFKECFNKGKD